VEEIDVRRRPTAVRGTLVTPRDTGGDLNRISAPRANLADVDAARPVDLTGHVALVTGANHGIGAATARALAARGAAVLLTYLRLDGPRDPALPSMYQTQRAGSADDLVAAIRAAGGSAEAMEADLTDPAAPAQLFDAAESRLGPVDILVNNASGWHQDTFRPVERPDQPDRPGRALRAVSAASIDQNLAVDARAAAQLIAEFALRHVCRGAAWGRIVGLTSGGPMGFPEEVSYGAAKAAQENYTMAAAVELAEFGITANMVHPPVTDTGWITDAVREAVAASPEHVHVAQPGEVAEVIVFLCSDQARLITGNVIRLR